MPQLSDDVTIAALVISLIALGVSYMQLTQQILSTVSAFRCCSYQVIGPWYRRRSLRPRFFELRLELRYETPKIVLVTPDELKDHANQQEKSVSLMFGPELNGNKKYRELDDTVHGEWIPDMQPATNMTAPSMRKLATSMDGQGSELEMAIPPPTDRVSNARHNPKTYGFWTAKQKPQPKSRRRGRKVGVRETEILATWLRFMYEIHSVYVGYFPEGCTAECNSRRKVCGGKSPRNPEAPCADNHARTEPAAIYCKWSWDFMPDDLIRPLARIDLGDMVVIALRLGMRWRSLDPGSGRLAAEGNGYSITASEEGGLGLVVRFNAGREDGFLPALVPSRAVDKLMCGIIPGDPSLVREDFDFIERLDGHKSLEALLTRIGVTYGATNTILAHGCRETNNELVMLLCPFLPLKGCKMVLHSFAGWVQSMKGVFSCWEGRVCLHRGLEQAIARYGSSKDSSLIAIRERLDTFRKEYADDYYVRRAKRALTEHHSSPEKQESLLIFLRDAFDHTTRYFREKRWHLADVESRTQYVDLVATHVCMADTACKRGEREAAKKRKEKQQPVPEAPKTAVAETAKIAVAEIPKTDDDENMADWVSSEKYEAWLEEVRKRYNVAKPEERGDWVSEEVFEKGLAYVDAVTNSKSNGIWNYILEKHKDRGLTREAVEEAWWMLMLRGIVWSASTNGLEQVSPVPASFYGDKTPLWIT
ncbi:hypothetical protein BAUCODRAFT_284405 [Baudoinia panamericana UAMH 10762]|uniref:Uncharacterized protein n=1 Tax=Baudoinia panamericana (strain UAMH 10762) TaxID=717646 RepID=M2MLM2_BAUPA|nr:uncharacterized protein BAUCODRAFT_284405 [Baudoinia panamericana UAMH 10762]EMC92293.1 hypothetical protein BAUCODRAFT_284405 [Baudoinia panamericana UAMH 10762]